MKAVKCLVNLQSEHSYKMAHKSFYNRNHGFLRRQMLMITVYNYEITNYFTQKYFTIFFYKQTKVNVELADIFAKYFLTV